MQLSEILTPERTFHAASGNSKKRVFEFLANQLVSGNNPAHMQLILDAFMARARLGSTGLGQGIAIPHCRLDSCTACTGALLTLSKPIEFDAPDNQPVDLWFVLVVPSEANDQHLQILAELAQRFSNEKFCQQLRSADSASTLYSAAMATVES